MNGLHFVPHSLVLLFNEDNVLFPFVCLSGPFVCLLNGAQLVPHSWVLLFNWDNGARVPLLILLLLLVLNWDNEARVPLLLLLAPHYYLSLFFRLVYYFHSDNEATTSASAPLLVLYFCSLHRQINNKHPSQQQLKLSLTSKCPRNKLASLKDVLAEHSAVVGLNMVVQHIIPRT